MRQGPGPLTDPDAALRAIVHANPRDELAWSVWADALEARGDSAAATVVRRAFALREAIAANSDDAIARARAVLDAATGLPRAWLAALAPPVERLADTVWGARDTEQNVYLIAFADDGTIHYVQGEPGEEPPASAYDAGKGAWMQIDRALAFSIYAAGSAAGPVPRDFTRHEGAIVDHGALLAGIGSDRDEQMWSWRLSRLAADRFQLGVPLPDLPQEPQDEPAALGDDVVIVTAILLGERRYD